MGCRQYQPTGKLTAQVIWHTTDDIILMTFS